jgi:tripartite-type tricarboxylate transporter receptor subunit TctC
MLVPIQVISAADSILHIVTGKMSAHRKQLIAPENLPGAAGVIALERAAWGPSMATNDGSLVITPRLYRKVNYGSRCRFGPVSPPAAINFVLIVIPSSRAKTVKEFLILAKSRPEEINYSSGGIGSAQPTGMEVLTARAGITLNRVPNRGATPAALDVIAGRVSCHFGATSIVLGGIRQSKVRE